MYSRKTESTGGQEPIAQKAVGQEAISGSIVETDCEVIDVSVIIVNYNVREFLIQALESVYSAATRLNVEVFVVDNNSVDDSVKTVRSRFRDVILICNKENIGFGSANNVAIRRARGRMILILNPDTIIQEDTLDVLVEFMDTHREVGAAGCRILNPDGSFARESRRTFPSADVAFYRLTGLSRLFPKSKRFGRYNLTYLPEDQTSEVDALSGSCMMIRSNALVQNADGSGSGSGPFDEAFFMYGEDLDLCFRIQKAGWKIFYVPRTQIIHYKGESTKKGELRYVRHFYGAMLLFLEKHLDTGRSRILTSVLRTGIMFRAGLSYFVHHARNVSPMFLDFAIVYVSVTLVGIAKSAAMDRMLAPLFYASVSPAYAISTVIGIYLTGGYHRPAEYRPRSAFAGIALGGLIAASTSFFLPAIAFSRVVVALSLPVAGSFLIAWRVRWNSRHGGPHRAVLVGDEIQAARLKRMLDAHPAPPFLLTGYVHDRTSANGSETNNSVRLGGLSQLRDLVRLGNIRDIVFAARCLSNQEIFDTMQSLRDLDVQFRMLHTGGEHAIGKSKISPISLGSLLAQVPEIVELRPHFKRRWFEIPVSVCGLLMLPVVQILVGLTGNPRLRFFSGKLRQLTRVISGAIYLVGVHPDHISRVPSTWELKEGVFSITNTLNAVALDPAEMSRVYWYYVTHQSSGLDLDIILRSIRFPEHS